MHLSSKLSRFLVTGILTTLIHICVATLLIEVSGASPAVGNGIAFLFATAFSLFVNFTWTFSASLQIPAIARFLTVTLGTMLFSMSLAKIVEIMGFPHWVSTAVVVMVVPASNYILHSIWTFKSR